MTDAEFEEQKARVETCLAKWLAPLRLDCWRVDVCYMRESNPDPNPGPKTGGNWKTTFKCSADWTRLDALITAYLPDIEPLEDVDLEQHVVHELCHIFLRETRVDGDDWLDHEERVATTLTRAFIGLRDSVGGEMLAVSVRGEAQEKG